jgi:uncharacterized protein (TIGR02266 family)
MVLRRYQKETRGHSRAPYRESVRYFDWDKARMAQGVEIAAGGMFLKTSAPLPEGRLVTLRLSLPGTSRGFTVLARVVRTVTGGVLREPGMGVQFVDITSSARMLIEGYVQGRLAA